MPFLKHNTIFAARYLLVELLEDVSHVEMWIAKDKWADGTLVVLKIFASGEKLAESLVKQVSKGFSLSNTLLHPHLLKISQFDISEKENAAYLVMPFYPLGTLSKLLEEEEGGFTETQIALLMCQMGAALKTLHGQNPPFLHNEVRPDNILISQPDFFVLSMPALYNQKIGSIAPFRARSKAEQKPYASPEFYASNQELDSSSDIFSLGVSLYVMSTQTLPWGGAGGESLLTDAEMPRLPEHYSPELNELLQACMSANTARRPGAEELYLRGKHFLETGKWDLSKGGSKKRGSLKRILPFILAAAVLGLFILSAFWEYQHNPLEIPKEKFQKMVSSGGQRQGGQEVDAMLIAMLEEERNELAKRNLELEKKNKQLMYFDSVNTVTLRGLGKSVDKTYNQAENGSIYKKVVKKEGAENSKADFLSSAASTPPKKEVKEDLFKANLEKQLNKISDPATSGNARNAWKEETISLFAEGAIRIVDETDGASKHYSAGIFLNLLYNVPHSIVVKEVKTNQSKKVTELRLTMEANN